ncbi:MAG TPA: Ku protein [Tepidisphaeraceae bacterium]|nr:Ku protein [Tepidisphaeraceae bacterium]
MAEETKSSSRPIWTGAISFGLVSIPVRLYTAVREKRLHFRTLHDQDKIPLKQKMVCPAHPNKEVHSEHTVKGFEIEKDRFVVVRQEELEAAAPKGGKAIEIQDFVELGQIDPLYFDKPYHVVPKPEGAKPYKLLLEVMEQTQRVAIAKVVMWGKENLAALRPLEGGMVLETMHFGDEVVAAKSVPGRQVMGKVDSRELKMATSLVDSLTTTFDPGKYHDDYREKVLKLIHDKAEGHEVVTRPTSEEEAPRGGQDLVAALEASLAAAKDSARGNGRVTEGRAAARNARHAHAHPGTHKRRRSA